MNNLEAWKDVPGYEGLYQVSNLGQVRSLKKVEAYILKPQPSPNGYVGIFLYRKDSKIRRNIHRIVAGAFIDNPENKAQVNHIDGNKQNNCVSNLEWCTPGENINHALKNGIGTIGEINGKAKLTNKQVKHLRRIYKPFDKKKGCKALADKYNVKMATMWRILKRKTYKHI